MARTLSATHLLNSPCFTQCVKQLYTDDLKSICERYSGLTEKLSGNIRFFSSPGRAELVGNHTDHNHGLVIAGSIDLDIACAVVKTNDNVITIKSEGYPAFTVLTTELQIDSELYGTTPALVRGICKGFLDHGYKIGGFTANATSNIFKGAGVSSSAAFELLIAEILNNLYNNGKIDYTEKAIIGQYAENVYFGKPSGLMDQLTISRGNVSSMNFATEIPYSETAEWNFDNLSLVIINCGGDHCALTNEYAAIRSEMEEIAGYFGKKVLGEIDKDEFFLTIPKLKELFPGRAILRAIHFFEENERVKRAEKAINASDEKTFLSLITESGKSSYELLQNCFVPGDNSQPVSLALAIVERYKDTLAFRVHGGGFAGTILAFTDAKNTESFVNYMKNIFGKENVFGVKIRKSGAVELPIL